MPGHFQCFHVFSGNRLFERILVAIQTGRGINALGTTNERQHFAQGRERLAAPVIANRTKQAVFDGVPLGCAAWIVTDGEGEVVTVYQLGLQFVFPHSGSIAVAASRIAEQQQFVAVGVEMLALGFPPGANAGDGKARRVMRNPQANMALLVFYVKDSIGRGESHGVLTKIVSIHLLRLPSPRAAWVCKVPYQFLLLAVGANNGMSLPQMFLPLFLDILKLFVAIGMWRPRETLATRAQRKLCFFNRRPIVSRPIWKPLAVIWEANLVRLHRVHFFMLHGSPAVFGSTSFARPFSIWGYLTSVRGRPAPGLRMRVPRAVDGGALISRLPRMMVLGCMPVKRDIRAIPP